MVVEDPYRQMERLRAERDRHRENSARTAFAWGFCVTKGSGEVRFAKRIDFRLAFLDEPAVAYGFSVTDVADNVDGGDVLVDTRFPRCSGGVYDWYQDSRGFYLGAWVFATMTTADPSRVSLLADPVYTIRHSYSFTGLAFKHLGDRVGDDL